MFLLRMIMADQARRGFTIRIFLPDGIPDGLRIVEKSNWTGRAVICATGYEVAQGFVVQAGSRAVKETVPSIDRYTIELRDRLTQREILVPDSDSLRLSQDYAFDSPST